MPLRSRFLLTFAIRLTSFQLTGEVSCLLHHARRRTFADRQRHTFLVLYFRPDIARCATTQCSLPTRVTSHLPKPASFSKRSILRFV